MTEVLRSEIETKSKQNRSKIEAKSKQNRSKIEAKSMTLRTAKKWGKLALPGSYAAPRRVRRSRI
ncbi:MAG: hypothetical protein ACYCYO_20885 [Bacilli bacterium]